jgi:hypothetical protein
MRRGVLRRNETGDVTTRISSSDILQEIVFRPFGAGSFETYTQGLRPGLYSFAASRLKKGPLVLLRIRKNELS